MEKRQDRRITTATKRNYSALGNGLLSLLQEKKFDLISVSQICEKANIPRVTFYNYFADKYEFLRFCIGEFVDAFSEKAERYASNFIDYCDNIAVLSSDFIRKNRRLAERFICAENCTETTVFQEVVSERFYEKITKNDVATKVPADLLSEYFSSCIICAARWLLSEGKEHTEEQTKTYFRLIFAPERFLF